MILDSTFLVDFEREIQQGRPGPASRFLEAHRTRVLAVSFTIAGEMACGGTLGGDRAKWERFLRPFEFLGYHPEVAWKFGEIYRGLRAAGKLIGANDLWIAATALANDRELVTRNSGEFSRVPGLKVLSY